MRLRILILALIFALWLVPLANASPYSQEIIKTAQSYSYVREQTNRNDSPEINRWLVYVGLDNNELLKKGKAGYSWCMAYVQYMYKLTYENHKQKNPLPRSARCADVWKLAKKDKYRYKTFTAKQVETGAVKLTAGDVSIWSHDKKSDDFNGHTGLVVSQLSRSQFMAIEGNTGASNDINQQREQTGISAEVERNGGVRLKERTVKKGSVKFQQEGFIRSIK